MGRVTPRQIADGADVKLDLPYILEHRDRHGNWRVYVRRVGKPMIRLHATPGTPEFVAEYTAALKRLDQNAPPAAASGKRRAAAPGSLRHLCEIYFASAEFKGLAPSTRRVRRQIFDRICDHGARDAKASRACGRSACAPDALGASPKGPVDRTGPVYRTDGDKPWAQLEAKHVRARRDALAEVPESANAIVKALRQLYAWAMEAQDARSNPARDVPYLKSGSDGHHSWTIDEVRRYEARHASGTKARMALALLLLTGVRRGDAVKLGP